jgi:hypothetical protein
MLPHSISALQQPSATKPPPPSVPRATGITPPSFATTNKPLPSRLCDPRSQPKCRRKLKLAPTCPIQRADGRGPTFTVNLDENAFCCFEASCQKKGDVIDL